MRKILPYILIFVVMLQLFAPFTFSVDKNKNLQIETNKAEAIELDFSENGYKKAFPGSGLVVHTRYVEPLGNEEPAVTGSIDILIDTGMPEGENSSNQWYYTEAKGANYAWGLINTGYNTFHSDVFVVVIKELSSNKSGLINVTNNMLIGTDQYGASFNLFDKRALPSMPPSIESNVLLTTTNLKSIDGLTKLKPGEKYMASLYYRAWSGIQSGVGYGENIPTISGGLFGGAKDYIQIAQLGFEAASQLNPIIEGNTTLQNSGQSNLKDGAIDLPECSFIPPKIGGCIAQAFYWILFKPTSFIFGLSGKMLDFTFFYSIKDTSYRSDFVVEGWRTVKDLCNMFFIFVLLYIAFGTILNLNGVKTKEMIINVIIVGLLINFSLFATHIIIDTSNILARVFYNQNTIVIGEKDKDTNQVKNETGDYGEIKLSEAIVSKVNPVRLITQSHRISNIPTKSDGVNSSNSKDDSINTGTFILVVFLATAVNVVGTIAFLSSALIFIGRVIMLWLAMIFAPLAFFSYIVPAMQDWKMVGWKNWWSDTLKMAFVAPVFAFFMYLIVAFLGTGLGLISADANSFGFSDLGGSLSFLIGIIVPFVFVMILIMKAKDVAVKMSGEIGAALSKAGAAVGGVGLAAATGGAAMAMRGTVGRLGNKMATSKFAKDTWVGRNVTGKVGKGLASSSFDVRNTKLGTSAAKGLGVESNIGKAKEGGFTKYREEQIEKKKKRAEDLKNTHSYKEKQAILDAQAKVNEEQQKIENSTEKQDVNIMKAALDAVKANPQIERDVLAKESELKAIERELQDLKDKNQGDSATADLKRTERDNKIAEIKLAKKPITDAENDLKNAEHELFKASADLRTAETNFMKSKNNLANTQSKILKDYAQSIQGTWGNAVSKVISFNQHSTKANEQAAKEILASAPKEKSS